MKTRSLQAVVAVLLLPTCINLRPMPPDQPCLEAGYAISSRVFDCSADGDIANEAFEDFRRQYACIEWDTSQEWDPKVVPEADLFHCAFAISAMDCEAVDACGDDLDCFLDESPTCGLVVTRADGSPLGSEDGGS